MGKQVKELQPLDWQQVVFLVFEQEYYRAAYFHAVSVKERTRHVVGQVFGIAVAVDRHGDVVALMLATAQHFGHAVQRLGIVHDVNAVGINEFGEVGERLKRVVLHFGGIEVPLRVNLDDTFSVGIIIVGCALLVVFRQPKSLDFLCLLGEKIRHIRPCHLLKSLVGDVVAAQRLQVQFSDVFLAGSQLIGNVFLSIEYRRKQLTAEGLAQFAAALGDADGLGVVGLIAHLTKIQIVGQQVAGPSVVMLYGIAQSAVNLFVQLLLLLLRESLKLLLRHVARQSPMAVHRALGHTLVGIFAEKRLVAVIIIVFGKGVIAFVVAPRNGLLVTLDGSFFIAGFLEGQTQQIPIEGVAVGVFFQMLLQNVG